MRQAGPPAQRQPHVAGEGRLTAMSVRSEDRVVAAPALRPARRRRLALAGVAVVAVGAAGTAMALTGGSGERPAAGPSPATADIVRTDLTDRTQVDGTLGYAGSYTVMAAGHGRLTWLPEEGATIRRGKRVYGTDGHGVPLFYGATPLWRPLSPGVSGADVREVERNLTALGYGDGVTVDEDFTSATAAAVRAWQDDLGVAGTGTVAPGDVVMQPGAIRIKKVNGTLGAPAGGRVLTATGASRQITVHLPVTQQELAVSGEKVGVDLPGGRSATGHISSVGTVARAGDDASDGQPQTGQDTQTATIPVDVTLDHASAAGRLDGAPVTVGFTSGTHRGVLAVPVQALLAAADGTYTVEVVSGAGRRQVPVSLGIFADGKVEVAGTGLAAGMKVEVPRT
jgi:peptidoglycan hydrolase-like protein with peptidoglycan-binding domain